MRLRSPVHLPILLLGWSLTHGDANPVSTPHFRDPSVPAPGNGSTQTQDRRVFEPVKLEAHEGVTGAGANCTLHLDLLWTADLGAPVFATPTIVDRHAGGGQLVIAPTLVHDVAAVDVASGTMPEGWPVSFEGSHFHAGAAVHDVNGDGVADVCVVSAEGHIFWLEMGEQGHYLSDYHVRVPTLRVRRDWYEGLDTGAPDVVSELTFFDHRGGRALVKDAGAGKAADAADVPAGGMRRRLQGDAGAGAGAAGGAGAAEQGGGDPGAAAAEHDTAAAEQDAEEYDWENGYEEWRDGYGDPYSSAYMGDDLMAGYWEAAYGGLPPHLRNGALNDSAYVHVDAHCLAAPAVADVDGDGSAEMIIAVSYFFDRRQYAGGHGLPAGVKPHKYVGGGVLVFDFALQEWLWTLHLDLTTDETRHRAYIYGPPTVADLDGDGQLEVVVGTAMGLVYVMRAMTGDLQEGFPVQFGEVQAQVAVADVVGDASLELIVGDMQGTVAVLDKDAREVWLRRTSGAMTNAAVVGDVDGDGRLDIVFAVTTPEDEGHLFAVNAATGEDLQGWPLRLGRRADEAGDGRGSGGLSGAPLLVDLHAGAATTGLDPNGRGLHVVVPSLDGHVYVVEGRTRCVRRVDIGRLGEGEHMYSQVLAADVGGELALLLATMGGTLTALGTRLPAHPLNLWDSTMRGGRNGFLHGSHMGVRIASVGTSWKRTLDIQFEVRDGSWLRHPPGTAERIYTVAISLGAGGEPLFTQSYTEPGMYTAEVKLSRPLRATITAVLTTDRGLIFKHSAEVDYMTSFPTVLAWLLCAPVAVAATQLFLYAKAAGT